MRNLKRALSLALASVMVLGLMVVGSGASYADVTAEQNQEAIDVLQAVGIMTGDQNGNFNPDANVTRNEMAVIMANLMDYRVANYKGTSPFSDVPSWAEPYVAACYTNGITNGIGGGLYGGEQNVTTAQAGLMMLKALGYFQLQSDFGEDWQLSTVSQGNKVSLFKDVDSAIVDPMTRNDVAQLVLNTLEAGMVELDDSSKISVSTPDGMSVDIGGGRYNYVTSGERYAYAIDDTLSQGSGATDVSTRGYIVELGEKLYMGDLVRVNWDKDEHTDDFGAPSTLWRYKNTDIGEYADKADFVFTGTVKSRDMYKVLGKTLVNNYDGYYYVDGVKPGDLDTDKDLGVRLDKNTVDPSSTETPKATMSQSMFTLKKSETNGVSVEHNNAQDLPGTTRGTTTYVYLDDNKIAPDGSKKQSVSFVVVSQWIADVVRVDEGKITLDDMNEGDLIFETEDEYEEGEVLLYTQAYNGGNWEIQEILGRAERVEGDNALVRDEDRVILDGKTYQYSKRYNDANGDKLGVEYVNNNVAFYTDLQGHFIMIDDVDLTNDYAFVYSVGIENSKYNDKEMEFGAKLILTDGTTKRVVIDTDDTDPVVKAAHAEGDRDKALNAVRAKFEQQIVGYSEDNGAYSLSVRTDKNNGAWVDATHLYGKDGFGVDDKDIIKNGSAQVTWKSGSYVYADKNTAFLIHEVGDDADEFSAYTGYNNVPSLKSVMTDADGKAPGATGYTGPVTTETVVMAYVSKNTGAAKTIVVLNANVSGTSNDVIFIRGEKAGGPKLNEDSAGNQFYVYNAVVDGEKTSLKIKADSEAFTAVNGIGEKKVGVYFGMAQNSSGIVTKLTTKIPADVSVNGVTATDANGKYAPYVGTKRVSSGGNVTFNTDETNVSVNGGKPASFSVDEDALVVYYNKDMDNAFTVGEKVRTDRNDLAWVVIDDGLVVAVCVKEMPN